MDTSKRATSQEILTHLKQEGQRLRIGFFDIDGTLLSFKTHTIPPSTLDALAQMQDRGILLYIASGRAPFQLPKSILHGQGAFRGFDGFLCNSGQLCMDMRGIFRKAPLTKEDVELVAHNADAHGFDYSFMTETEIFVNHIGPRVQTLQNEANVSFKIGNLADLGDAEIYQMNVFVTPEEEPLIIQGTKDSQSVRWCDDFTDIIPAQGGKDVGIQAVLEHYELNQAQAFAFGDGGNDATMLQYVGDGVAMGNADFRAKDVASIITASVEEDGVYKACLALGLIEDRLHLFPHLAAQKVARNSGVDVIVLK